ncbi:MAG: hypothetical protein IPL46_30305 [Saprospiraceae bacterium]|nr:hypothetical protein [Saprospiraceae bacterium]
MRKNLTFFFIIFTSSLTYAQILITDYGARPGEICTESIQAAIDTAYNRGGGMVIIPPGHYIAGTIELKSNIELHLAAGAVLVGSTDLSHYQRTFRSHGIIFSYHAINVSITGLGTIDGQGDAFYDFTQSHTYPEFDRADTSESGLSA